MRHQFAAPLVFGTVAVESRAPGKPVADRIERNSVAGDERRVVAQYGLALGVAAQRIDALTGQPYDRPDLAQSPIVRVRIDDRTGA